MPVCNCVWQKEKPAITGNEECTAFFTPQGGTIINVLYHKGTIINVADRSVS